jgi:hypothetical protein
VSRMKEKKRKKETDLVWTFSEAGSCVWMRSEVTEEGRDEALDFARDEAVAGAEADDEEEEEEGVDWRGRTLGRS